ncbi:hypothetical protein JTE90_014578 [Oedothorax gibbosus]|uniref:Uncharacterized protein n=1 Tax=Oedothorax gibbosus TaxID=931172 RepID=A0AAV6UMS3_9ARAC|nr:hypothetical protein JTE90_014578 [Oedothorax gibbosus]
MDEKIEPQVPRNTSATHEIPEPQFNSRKKKLNHKFQITLQPPMKFQQRQPAFGAYLLGHDPVNLPATNQVTELPPAQGCHNRDRRRAGAKDRRQAIPVLLGC